MDVVKLKARVREASGKSYTRKARSSGWIPAVFYGKGIENKSIEIDSDEFNAIVRKKLMMHIIELDLEGGPQDSIIKDYQRHPYKDGFYYSVDFQHIVRGEKVTVTCNVKLVGTPEGVKLDGGILSQPTKSVEIECIPSKIPENIEVDVAKLKLGESIHVSDVDLDGVTIKESADEVLATVVLPKGEASEDVEAAGDEDSEASEEDAEK